ncbi:UNVERIFIED_CONTAM: hypothetical protein HDU68_000017 [Siphonaria sp. JEL0065]|nr:hypothetical protein HDU68_000017 [Siphonaria sp. JEL0065]
MTSSDIRSFFKRVPSSESVSASSSGDAEPGPKEARGGEVDETQAASANDNEQAPDDLLPPGVSYSAQWEAVIAEVFANEAYLLGEADVAAIHSFKALSNLARDSFVRLMLRKHKIERVAKLNWEVRLKDWRDWNTEHTLENDDRKLDNVTTQSLLDELGTAMLLDLNPVLDSKQILDLLSRTELLDLAKQYKIPKHASLAVPALQAAILENSITISQFSFSFSSNQKSAADILYTKLKTVLGPCIYIPNTIVETFYRLFIIYNREREWPDNPFLPHIRTNLKTNRLHFNKYTVNRVSITWPTAADLTEYIQMLKLSHEILTILSPINGQTPQETRDSLELKAIDLAETCIPVFEAWVVDNPEGHISGIPWLTSFTAGRVAASILRDLATLYTRHGMDAKAIQVYHWLLNRKLVGIKRGRGACWDSCMKALVKLGQVEEAFTLGCDALRDSAVEFGRRREIENRLIRLSKKLNKKEKFHAVDTCADTMKKLHTRVVYADKTFSATGRKALYRDTVTSEDVIVEQLALNVFERLGFKGVHAENSVVTTLFGLLFWDILFDDTVPGVFTTPFQDAPMDLATEFFYSARKHAIDTRLSELAAFPDTKHLEIISKIDQEHRTKATQCRGVYWNLFSRQDLMDVASCFNGSQLACICDAFIQSYGAHSGGVPDLCVWKVETKEVKLVEVKGEGDHLSHSQVMWLDLMTSCGICVELFKVQLIKNNAGGKRKRVVKK